MSAACRRNPQHFHCACTGLLPFCTSDPHACAQKNRPAVLLPAIDRGAAVRGPRPYPAMATEHRAGALRRSPTRRTGAGAVLVRRSGRTQ